MDDQQQTQNAPADQNGGQLTYEQIKKLRETQQKLREAKQNHQIQQITQQRWLQNHPEEQAKIKAVQEKAQFDATNFEKRYTAKQKADIAQLNKASQDMEGNPNYSEEEKKQIKDKIEAQKLGIKPADLPKLSPHPKGQDIGDSWVDKPTGDQKYRTASGEVHTVDYKKTKEGAYQESLHERQQNELKAKEDGRSSIQGIRERYLFEESTDENGKVTRRQRSPEELNDLIQSVIGTKPTQKQLSEFSEKQQRAHQQWLQNRNQQRPANYDPNTPSGYNRNDFGHKIDPGTGKPFTKEEYDKRYIAQEEANDDIRFAQSHRGNPALKSLIVEHARQREERVRDEARAKHEQQLEKDKTRREDIAHQRFLSSERARFRTYKEEGTGVSSGTMVTKTRTPQQVDKFMREEYGVTGREHTQHQSKENRPPQSQNQPVKTLTSGNEQAEFDALPDGALFWGHDGKVKVKRPE